MILGLENIYYGVRIYFTPYFQVWRIDNSPLIPEIKDIGRFLIPKAPCYFNCFFTEKEWNEGLKKGKECEGII